MSTKIRGELCFLFIFSILVGQSRAPAAERPAENPPNFVFIFGDDWGWGDLGCYGHPTLKTPNLDALARDGILFTQFYVNAPVCSPSRTGFLTGQFPSRHGVHGHFADPELNARRDMPDWLDPEVVTIADLLKGAGYMTGHFGKWHLGGGANGNPSAPEPKEYGIDIHRVFNGNGPTWDNGRDFRPHSTEAIVDETIRFIEQNREGPFYVQAWLLDTHAYLNPTEEQREPYKNLGGALEVYYGAATAADHQIGRLIAKHSGYIF
jgi:N-acetylgalactosamine-6-sulfatase